MPCYVELEIAELARLPDLERVIAALRDAKQRDEWHDDAYWLGFFDESARAHFWWPTDAERAEHSRRWFATPVETRWTDASLRKPWDFGSLIDAFRNGDYELLGIRRTTGAIARIEYEPFGDPYGGTACMVALVEAFGFRVVDLRD